MLIAKYTANASRVVPTFNAGYQYTINSTVSNGIYTVEISSDTDFTNCSFNGISSLLTVDYLKVTNKVTTMYGMFFNCPSLSSLDLSNWDTNKVTTMEGMFADCHSLTSLDLSNWDVSNVSNMEGMFYGCSNLTTVGNISNWDVSNVSNMESMFFNCPSLTSLDLSNWDTNKVTTMYGMFYGCSNLTTVGNISNWDTNKVTNMYSMFFNCESLTSLDASNWDTNKVTTMYGMFAYCYSLTSLDLSNWDVSNVSNMEGMFADCHSLTSLDLSNWDVSNVSNNGFMFENCNGSISIGMIYCSLSTINTLSSLLPTSNAKQVYVQDVSSSECAEVSNITFIDYVSDSEIITLPVTLVPGDKLLWDDSSQRYIIQRADGKIIQTDMSSKFKIDLYIPYTMICADNVTSITVNINRKEM